MKIGAVDKLPKLPSQYFLDNFVITTAGASASCAPPTFMDGAVMTEDERKQIYETNARRVFKLKA